MSVSRGTSAQRFFNSCSRAENALGQLGRSRHSDEARYRSRIGGLRISLSLRLSQDNLDNLYHALFSELEQY
jgi:hypothetical protein